MSILSALLKYTFYASTALFLIALFCIALHFMGVPIFSFDQDDNGVIPMAIPVSYQTSFHTVPIPSDLSCNFVNSPATRYTLSFDAFIVGDFITTGVPRVLLYRSPYPIALQRTDTLDTMASLFSNSNIVVYLDPVKNDLYVAALKSDSRYITSDPIKNVPLRVPFKITLVVSSNFLEVYLNGKLQQMIPFNGGIVESSSKTYFFGPPPIVNRSIMIGNIQLWNTELSSNLVRVYGQQEINAKLFAGN